MKRTKKNRGAKIPSQEVIDFSVRMALAEDIGPGDITTKILVPKKTKGKGEIRAKEDGVIAGLAVAAEVFRQIDRQIRFLPKIKDGSFVKKGRVIALLSGPAQGILSGERVALNFLQHLSGIATLTRKLKHKIKGETILLDTRKTTPGLRALEKYAVAAGGGTNHRLGLHDAILIKDNHLKLVGGVKQGVAGARRVYKGEKGIEVETKNLAEVREAIAFGADRVLLDNMDVRTLKRAVRLCRQAEIKTEASGGVNLQNVAAISQTGVDYVSVGALTHSAPALDISLKLV